MPIIKSAKKRVRVSNKARSRNAIHKSSIRNAFKSFQSSLDSKKNSGTSTSKAHSELDKAAKKGLMHKNKVARKKRQMAAATKKAGIKPEKTTAKKSVTTKKPVAVKKPTAKAKKATTTKKTAKK